MISLILSVLVPASIAGFFMALLYLFLSYARSWDLWLIEEELFQAGLCWVSITTLSVLSAIVYNLLKEIL